MRFQSENCDFGAETGRMRRLLALMEKRLKEAGLSTEQMGQHELIREFSEYSFGFRLNGAGPQAPRQKDGRIRFQFWRISVHSCRHSTNKYRPKFKLLQVLDMLLQLEKPLHLVRVPNLEGLHEEIHYIFVECPFEN